MKNFIKDMKTKKIAFAAVALLLIMTVGATMAYFTEKTGAVVNTFKAGDISTDVDEEIENLTKKLTVTNTGNGSCLVRISLTATPEEYLAMAEDNPEIKNGLWVDGGDGFWYYQGVLASKGDSTDIGFPKSPSFSVTYETTEAFNELSDSEKEAALEDMDVTVYQEAVQASANGISAVDGDGNYSQENAMKIWELFETGQLQAE